MATTIPTTNVKMSTLNVEYLGSTTATTPFFTTIGSTIYFRSFGNIRLNNNTSITNSGDIVIWSEFGSIFQPPSNLITSTNGNVYIIAKKRIVVSRVQAPNGSVNLISNDLDYIHSYRRYNNVQIFGIMPVTYGISCNQLLFWGIGSIQPYWETVNLVNNPSTIHIYSPNNIIYSQNNHYAIISNGETAYQINYTTLNNNATGLFSFPDLSFLNSFTNIRNAETKLSNFYREKIYTDDSNKIRVPESSTTSNIPSSGQISIGNFRGSKFSYTLLRSIQNPTGQPSLFGGGLAINDNGKALIGATLTDDFGLTDTGKAFIVNVSTGNIEVEIRNPDGADGTNFDYFGTECEISPDGNYYAVAAPSIDGGIPKVYIFNNSGTLIRSHTNPNINTTNAIDKFGRFIAINNAYIAISAYLEDDTGGVNSGVVYLYSLSTGNIVYTFTNPSSNKANDFFGASLAIDINYLLVGATGQTSPYGVTNSGAVYIFNLSTSGVFGAFGTLLDTIENPDSANASLSSNVGPNDDNFGIGLSVDYPYAVVGSTGNDVFGSNDGSSYIIDVVRGDIINALRYPSAVLPNNRQYGYPKIGENRIIVGGYFLGSDTLWVYDAPSGTPIQSLTASSGYKYTNKVAISNKYVLLYSTNNSDSSLNKVDVYGIDNKPY